MQRLVRAVTPADLTVVLWSSQHTTAGRYFGVVLAPSIDWNPIIPGTPSAYAPGQPDADVATLYGFDGLGRTSLITQTEILTGSATLTTK